MLTVKALKCVTNAFLIGLLKISQNTKLQARHRRYTNGGQNGDIFTVYYRRVLRGPSLIPEASTSLFLTRCACPTIHRQIKFLSACESFYELHRGVIVLKVKGIFLWLIK